jgi:hypothetical protein
MVVNVGTAQVQALNGNPKPLVNLLAPGTAVCGPRCEVCKKVIIKTKRKLSRKSSQNASLALILGKFLFRGTSGEKRAIRKQVLSLLMKLQQVHL